MDPQVSKILLKTSRYKTEIFKLETKRKSMADKKKNKTKQLWRDFLSMQNYFS